MIFTDGKSEQEISQKSFVKQFAEHQKDENPTAMEEGDYFDNDGLIVCGRCGERKQTRLKLGGEEIIVPCICKCRKRELEERDERDRQEEQERTVRTLKLESLMAGKFENANFEHYVRRTENADAYRIAKNYTERFDDMLKNNQGLLFWGPVGTGKSYTAACIANALLEQGRSVIMTSCVKLLQDFRDEDAEQRLMETIENVSLAIIDDLGAERNTDFALEKVYNVIDSRVRAAKPLILTTNLTLHDMEHTEDIRYRRIYDRIFEVCYPVEMQGTSLRSAQAAIRRRNMENLLNEEGTK